MQRRPKIVFLTIFIFAIAVFLLIGFYAYLYEQYQRNYIQRVQAGVVDVITSCPYDRRNVVVVVIDGLRYSEAFASGEEFIPHIWNDLRPKGTIYTNCWIESASLTTTSHSVMLTGYHQYLSNNGYIHPTLPTFIELYRDARTAWFEGEFAKLFRPSRYFPLSKQTRAAVAAIFDKASSFPIGKTYCIVGKERILDAVNHSSHPACMQKYDSVIYRNMHDRQVYDVFEAKLGHDKPRIFFINLADVDEEGHTADWGRYTRAIREADEIVWKMWNDIQAHPAYRDKTDFILLADHGRHDAAHGDFAHHGDRCGGCLHVPLLLLGPDFKEGEVRDEYAAEYDIHPTVGRLVGFETPLAIGRVLEEAMVDRSAWPSPVETELTKALKQEMKALQADSVGEWLKWAQRNVGPEVVGGADDFALMTYLLGLVECVRLHADDAGMAKDLIEANADRNGVVLPAVWLAEYSGDDAVAEIARKGAGEMYSAVAHGNSDGLSLNDVAIVAPALCRAGAYFDEKAWVNAGAEILIDRMVSLEGNESLEGDLNRFVTRFDYFLEENLMYTREMTPREKALFFAAFGLSLEGTVDDFDDGDLYLIKRNLRLQMAFAAPDCDAMCLYAGESDFNYPADVIATNYLYDAIIACQTPWIKEEFTALGYGPEINWTAIKDFPSQHYFYILNLGNAFLNSGTNYDKIRITINWDDIFAAGAGDESEALAALGAALLAGARWGSVTKDDYSFNLYPPEWM
jgi:hypothetical protein